MKKLIMMVLIFTMACGVSYSESVVEILKKMTQADNYKSAVMTSSMKIVDRDGRETLMKMKDFEKQEGDKTLMRFTYPSRLKGTAILKIDDSIWYYNKRTNRVRLLSKSAKQGSMMGSSFSYDDMGMDFEKDFKAEIVENKKDYYLMKLFPRDKNKKYVYIMAKVRKDNYIAEKIDYYNDAGIRYKEMLSKDIVKIGNTYFPLNTVMTDIMDSKITYMLIDRESIELDTDLSDRIFSERNLEK